MKTKLRFISFFISLSLLIAIIYVGFTIFGYGANHYLIAVPKISGNGLPIKTLEEVNENKAMLTYENIYSKTIKALQSNFSVVLKGTNYTYPHVMNYSFTSGGFFTKEESENKNKVAVINEKTAFDIYGTLNAVGNELQIDRTPYIVIGVMNDNDEENLNVFIPASCLAESAQTITVNLSPSSGLIEEYVKNEFKHIGITELNYDFLNLGSIIKATRDKALVSIEVISFGFILLIIKKTANAIVNKLREINRERQRLYPTQMLKNKNMPVQKLILLLITIGGMITLNFLIVLNMFERALSWNSLKGVFNNINYASFAMNIAYAERLYLLSNVLFIGFVLFFVIFMLAIWD